MDRLLILIKIVTCLLKRVLLLMVVILWFTFMVLKSPSNSLWSFKYALFNHHLIMVEVLFKDDPRLFYLFILVLPITYHFISFLYIYSIMKCFQRCSSIIFYFFFWYCQLHTCLLVGLGPWTYLFYILVFLYCVILFNLLLLVNFLLFFIV